MNSGRKPVESAESPDKFREMILYVARLTEADPRCGSTKLNKILFYADFDAYRKLGRSISGQEYQKQNHGPLPRGFLPAVNAMEREGHCAWSERDYFGKNLKKLFALHEPDLSVFSPQEVDILHGVVERLKDLNATEVSDLSHNFIGWQAAEYGETIPYGTVFVGEPTPLGEDEMTWADEVIREHREELARDRQASQI